MRNSNGEYFCFLDDDDIFYEDKILKQVEFLEKKQIFNGVGPDKFF